MAGSDNLGPHTNTKFSNLSFHDRRRVEDKHYHFLPIFDNFLNLCLNHFLQFVSHFLFEPHTHHPHAILTQHLLFVCTIRRDIDSDDSHALSSRVLHSPLSGSNVTESCAQDTKQIHGKHGRGAPLNPVSCLFLVC